MSRKGKKIKRHEIVADQKYHNVLATRFVNCLMSRGKKSVALRIFYGALDKVENKISEPEVIEIFTQAIANVKPMVEVKSRRVGGANYQIPIEVAPARREALAIRWLLIASRKRGEKTMVDRLANEIMDAFNKTGIAIKKREDTHRMAEANKAFAHYRW